MTVMVILGRIVVCVECGGKVVIIGGIGMQHLNGE